MNKPRMWWAGDEQGWIVDTELALTNAEVLRIIEYTKRVQEDRLHGLMPGPVRDECLRTVSALTKGRVVQNIVGTGDKVLFDAYKSEGKKVFA